MDEVIKMIDKGIKIGYLQALDEVEKALQKETFFDVSQHLYIASLMNELREKMQ